MELEKEPETKIPCATRVQYLSSTVPFLFASFGRLLFLREVNYLIHDIRILLSDLHKFVILTHSSATPVQLNDLNRPTFATTWLSLVHCLDLEGATERFIG